MICAKSSRLGRLGACELVLVHADVVAEDGRLAIIEPRRTRADTNVEQSVSSAVGGLGLSYGSSPTVMGRREVAGFGLRGAWPQRLAQFDPRFWLLVYRPSLWCVIVSL